MINKAYKDKANPKNGRMEKYRQSGCLLTSLGCWINQTRNLHHFSFVEIS